MSNLKKLESPSHLEAFRQEILSTRDAEKQAVKVCCTTGCRAGGALKIIDAFEKELSEKGLEGKVEIKKTGCRGFCEKGPVMVVEPEKFESADLPKRSSDEILEGVMRADSMQKRRFKDHRRYRRNADLPLYALDSFCLMDDGARGLLNRAQRTLRFSARSRRNIIQVARTIADLEGSDAIAHLHIAEAVQYRVPPGLL